MEDETEEQNTKTRTLKSKKKKKKRRNGSVENTKEENNNSSENEEEKKPKKKKLRKKKLKDEENEEKEDNDIDSNNDNNEEEEETKKKKLRKKKKKKKNIEEENENFSENEDEEKPKKKKRRKKKLKEENNEEKEINDENEENEEIQKPKKRKKKIKKNLDDNENIDEEEIQNTFSKKSKSTRKKRKKKSPNDDEQEDNKIEFADQLKNCISENTRNNPLATEENVKKFTNTQKFENFIKKCIKNQLENNDYLSKTDIHKTKKKKQNNDERVNIRAIPKNRENDTTSKSVKHKSNWNNLKSIVKITTKKKNINKNKNNNNEEEVNTNINTYVKEDENWKNILNNFMEEMEKFEEKRLFKAITFAVVNIYQITKRDYGKFILNKKHKIYPIKKANNINWANAPFKPLKDKLLELSAPNKLINKNNSFDFSNRICIEYEPYTPEFEFFKVEGDDIFEKPPVEKIEFSPKNMEKITHVLLLYSFQDENSLILYKEILKFKEENENDFEFLPIYAPLILQKKNAYYVTEMLSKYKIYNKGEKYKLYFTDNEELNKRFKYISDDNKRTITCKIIIINNINDKFIIKNIRKIEDFSLNLISESNIDQNKYHSLKEQIKNLIKEPKNYLKDISEPFNLNWSFKKVKIFGYEDGKFKINNTFYESIGGSVYLVGENQNSEIKNFEKTLKNLGGGFQINYKNNSECLMSFDEQNQLIIDEMNNYLKSLKDSSNNNNIFYKRITQKQEIFMNLCPLFKKNQIFSPIENNTFKLEINFDINLFKESIHKSLTGSLYSLTSYIFFQNCDYIACFPLLGNKFYDKLKLKNSKDFLETDLEINSDLDKPSIIVVFSLSSQNYFASIELNSKLKKINKELKKFYEKKSINIYLILRGNETTFKNNIEEINYIPLFKIGYPIYLLENDNNTFPLYYKNNDIESSDSQLMTFVLNKANQIVYMGNLYDVNLEKSFTNLCNEESNEVKFEYGVSDIKELKMVYKNAFKFDIDTFEKKIEPLVLNIQEILKNSIEINEDELLYRPFISLVYNTGVDFIKNETDNVKYIYNIRLRILIKQKHYLNLSKNKEFELISTELKKYTAFVIVNIPCEELTLGKKCDKCSNNIEDNDACYYDDEEEKLYCEDCGEKQSKNINNENFLIFIKSTNFDNEIISEMYNNYHNNINEANPSLGDFCKICNKKIEGAYFLNLTHLNIFNEESPLTPLDICEVCFNEIKNGEPFINDPLRRNNYDKIGLSYKHMVYRKIFTPTEGEAEF